MKLFSKKNDQHNPSKRSFFRFQLEDCAPAQQAYFAQHWEYCRGLFHSPLIAEPKASPPPKGYVGAHHSLATGETWIDAEFVKKLARSGSVEEEVVLRGIMIRQIATYMHFPRTLANAIILEKLARDFCGLGNEEAARFLVQSFSSICADSCCVLDENKAEYILGLRKALANANPEAKMHQAVLAYLYLQSRRKEEAGSFEKQVEILQTADFTKAGESLENMRLALAVWVRFLKSFGNEMTGLLSFGKGIKNDGVMFGRLELVDQDQIEDIKAEPVWKVRKSLSEAASHLSKYEYDELENMIFGLTGRSPKIGEAGSAGIYIHGEIQIDAKTSEYYLTLIDNYFVDIEKMPIETDTLRKVAKGTERFSIGSPIYKAMPYTSGGMILPGLTRMHGTGFRKRKTVDYCVPDALVLIDSSDSMPNPIKTKSAIVATAVAVAKAYLKLGSRVGVINFGPKSYYLDYCRKEEEIFLSISAKQHGGTKINIPILRSFIWREHNEKGKLWHDQDGCLSLSSIIGRNAGAPAKQEKHFWHEEKDKPIDIFIFTDMRIINRKELLDLILDSPSTNRIVIATNQKAESLPDLPPKVVVYENINDVEQGMRIVIEQAGRITGRE